MAFKVYKSSAGSGKTYNLVKEYLCIVLKKPSDYRRVLAITFTNKAAEEMKSRIIEKLVQIINNDKNADIENYIEDISAIISLNKEQLCKNAQEVIGLILHNYSDFAVSTIDSFIYGIVRTFAKDLYLPLNFDVEMDAVIILEQAVDVLISKVGNHTDITELLVRFIENQIEDQRTLNIENEIKRIGKYLFNEESTWRIENLKNLTLNDFFRIQKKIFESTRLKENELKKIAHEAVLLIDSHKISPQEFYYKDKGIYNYFKNIYTLKFDRVNFSNSFVRKGVEEDKWTSNLCSDENEKIINSIKDELSSYYYKIQDFCKEELEKMYLFSLINKNLFPMALLGEISALIEDIKKENNILHISEFNKKIASIVFNEPVPFIYERLGVRFRHIMIDEFQDTSVLQWQNVLPLFENALAESGLTMVVGDAKQAIYRFRDGDVEQFINLPAINAPKDKPMLLEREKLLKSNYQKFELKKNFRSHKQIIDFNNNFFKTTAHVLNEKYTPVYEDANQQSDEKKTGGFVNIHFVERNNNEIIQKDNHLKIKEIIEELIYEKNFNLSDIAILCRNNSNANGIARFLIENNINVVSSESLLLSKSPLINFIISILGYIDKKENKTAAINIATYLNLNDKLSEIILTDLHLNVAKDSDYLIRTLFKYYPDFNYDKFQLLPLYELCEEIIRVFAFDKPNAYIQFFLDTVYDYSVKYQGNLSDFIRWWTDNEDKHSVIVAQLTDAIKIMTIHKAKGLQFPVVIYPFAYEPLKMTKDNIWVNINCDIIPELTNTLLPNTQNLNKTKYNDIYLLEQSKSTLDLINLLYVVLTRPVEKLFIISEMPPKKTDKISVNNLFKKFLVDTQLWNDELRDYSFGDNSVAAKKYESNTTMLFPLDNYISTRWQNKLLMKYKARDVWHINADDNSLNWGNLIHNILCNIYTFEDVEKTIQKFYDDGLISNEAKALLNAKINLLIKKPELLPYFSHGIQIMNEIEIMDSNGQLHRPDRLVFINNDVAVIDYKTGKELQKHIQQIDNYAILLNEMNFKNVKKILVYIENEKVIVW